MAAKSPIISVSCWSAPLVVSKDGFICGKWSIGFEFFDLNISRQTPKSKKRGKKTASGSGAN